MKIKYVVFANGRKYEFEAYVAARYFAAENGTIAVRVNK